MVCSAKCSIVVCTRNRPAELQRCLSALIGSEYEAQEIIVVDNAPSDDSSQKVAARNHACYVVEPRMGLSRARNLGARVASGEVVAYIDDDAVPAADWVSRLMAEFQDPDTMVVTGPILPLDGGSRSAQPLSAPAPQIRAVDSSDPCWFEMANYGGIGDGSNMAFRRRLFEVWPGFDERLGLGAPLREGEEHYAFFQLLERGFRVVCAPSAIVYHPVPHSAQKQAARAGRASEAAIAYTIFLFFRYPQYRRRLLRHLWRGLLGMKREWRGVSDEQPGRLQRASSRVRRLLCVVQGLKQYMLFLWSGIDDRSRPVAAGQGAQKKCSSGASG